MLSYADPIFVRRAVMGARVCIALVFCVAGVVLMGWILDVPRLCGLLHPNGVAMNPMTAACFALAAGSIAAVLPRPTSPVRRGIGLGLAAGVLFVAAGRLADLHPSIEFPIDALLFPHRTNTMAPNTALSFALIGLGLLLLDLHILGRYWLPQPCILLAGAITLLSIVGYLYDVQSLYHFGPFIPMALSTALTFAALTAGILLARPMRQPIAVLVSSTAGGTLARQLMPASIIFPICLGWLRLEGERVGLYSAEFGLSALVLLVVIIFNVLIWWSAVLIHRLDAERWRGRELIQEKNRQLEQTAASEREAYEALKRAQATLVQSEKLASLGQLVAGVAHEINNPLAFVSNNVAVLERDIRAVAELLEDYRRHDELLARHAPQAAEQLARRAREIDLEFTLANYREVMSSSREGLRRIQQIVRDLRDFARLDERDLKETDLNASIESTINIIRGQARKRQVEIRTDLHDLPPVTCYPAKINQVILNLVTNAIDATDAGGTITVGTEALDGRVRIRVEDTGRGMTPEIRQRIFDPFFTTKKQGEGMGLGLSISYGIVRDHGGTIEVDSQPGAGSTFTIDLPIK